MKRMCNMRMWLVVDGDGFGATMPAPYSRFDSAQLEVARATATFPDAAPHRIAHVAVREVNVSPAELEAACAACKCLVRKAEETQL